MHYYIAQDTHTKRKRVKPNNEESKTTKEKRIDEFVAQHNAEHRSKPLIEEFTQKHVKSSKLVDKDAIW